MDLKKNLLSMHTGPGEFVWLIIIFIFSKIKNDRQNSMSFPTARNARPICSMFGLNERPYPNRFLIRFW